jgi:hypothetical protein
METFDPSRRCLVHDTVNDVWVRWTPIEARDYSRAVMPAGDGSMVWHSMVLDRWIRSERRKRRTPEAAM